MPGPRRRAPGHQPRDHLPPGQNILVAHERTSRATLILRPQGRHAEPTAAALAAILGPLPPALRRSITFDNGTEFARHHRLTEQLGMPTFFCDIHSPWQKGGVENAIGRLRRTLPRKTDLNTLSTDTISNAARTYNTIPRKCLDYQTPAEIWSQQPLHFKCESTPPPARG